MKPFKGFVRSVAAMAAVVVSGGACAAPDSPPACAVRPEALAWHSSLEGDTFSADVDGVPLHGRRVWFDIRTHDEGSAPLRLALQMAFDPRPGGSMTFGDAGELFAPPHADGHLLLSAWVGPDIKQIEVRTLRSATPDMSRVGMSLRCSKDVQRWGEPSSQQALLDEAFDLYAANALHAPADPARLRQWAQGWATGAEVPEDVFLAMRAVMFNAGDQHSYIVPVADRAAFYDMLAPTPPIVKLRDDRLAFVAVSQVGFDGDDEARRKYARELHAAVARVALRHPRGWIVDLRGFGGGDMWTTLAGLSALVDGPLVGEFVARGGRTPWLVASARAGTASSPIVDVGTSSDEIIDAPVAVLIGPNTGSSGETTAIAFEHRPRSRFFGQPTLGIFNSGVVQHRLSDGTMFGIAEVLNADRTGHVYDGPIVPDVVVAEADDPVRAAAAWLLQQRHQGVRPRPRKAPCLPTRTAPA